MIPNFADLEDFQNVSNAGVILFIFGLELADHIIFKQTEKGGNKTDPFYFPLLPLRGKGTSFKIFWRREGFVF